MRVTRDIGKGMAARPSATLAEATLGDAAAMAASNMVDMGAEARTFFTGAFSKTASAESRILYQVGRGH